MHPFPLSPFRPFAFLHTGQTVFQLLELSSASGARLKPLALRSGVKQRPVGSLISRKVLVNKSVFVSVRPILITAVFSSLSLNRLTMHFRAASSSVSSASSITTQCGRCSNARVKTKPCAMSRPVNVVNPPTSIPRSVIFLLRP